MSWLKKIEGRGKSASGSSAGFYRYGRTILFASVFGAALAGLAANFDGERSGAESVEQRQLNELKRYYSAGARSGVAGVPQIPMAISFYNDAVQFFEKGEYEIAREAATESIHLDPRNPLAWELLGEIENLRQNFDKAGEYYKKSYGLNASPRVKAKLEKLNKERLVEEKMDTYHEEHFVIKYDRSDSQYEGFFLKNLLREIYRKVSRDLGFYIRHKIVVIFYKPEDFRYVTEQPHFVGGIYDGKIRLPAYRKGFSERELRATAAHEMTHAFVAYLSSLRAPAWIQEGLAQVEENSVRPIDLSILQAAFRSQKLYPVEEMLLMELKPEMPHEQVSVFYQQSFSFVSYLVKRFGMYRMKEILQEMRKGSDSFAAIEEVLKISPHRLEKEWLTTIRK